MARKVLLIAAALVVVLLVAAGGALYWFLSGDGIRRALEEQATAWLGQPVRIESARATFLPRIGVELGNVRAGDPARVTLQSVAISAPLRPLLSRRVEEAEITVSGSRVELPLPFELPASGGDGSAESRAPSEPALRIVSVRAITLRDIVVASRGREVTVSADSSLAGTRLTVQRFTASSGKTALDASGVVQLEPHLDAMLTITANQLDVDEMLALAAAFSPRRNLRREPQAAPRAAPASSARSGAAAAHISAKITAETARAGALEVQQLAADFESTGERVSLSPLTFQLFGGQYQGAIEATLGDSLAASIESRITDLDVAQLAAFGGVPDAITGRLSGAGTFTGQGADVEGALANAKGSGTARLATGTINRLDLVRTIVLFFGRPDSSSQSAGNRYERIDLKFSLANQIFRADAFTFNSPDVDISGTGTLAIPTKGLDGTLTLSLSEDLSKQAGTDLVRLTREGNRVTLPARLGGTLEKPSVTIDAKAALSRGLRNEGERRLKGLLDGLLK